MKKPEQDAGALIVTLHPGTELHIGDDIIIQLAEFDRSGNRPRPQRLRIQAPKNIKIHRYEDGKKP